MNFASRERLILNRSENVCSFCKHSFACCNLKTAIDTLEAEVESVEDSHSLELYLCFKEKLESYGFNYPYAQKLCWRHNKKAILSSLIAEATKITHEIRYRKLKEAPLRVNSVG